MRGFETTRKDEKTVSLKRKTGAADLGQGTDLENILSALPRPPPLHPIVSPGGCFRTQTMNSAGRRC